MNEHIKQRCIHEESIHLNNLKNIEKKYDIAFDNASTYEELLELDRWAEVTRENEMKRFANAMRKLLTEE